MPLFFLRETMYTSVVLTFTAVVPTANHLFTKIVCLNKQSQTVIKPFDIYRREIPITRTIWHDVTLNIKMFHQNWKDFERFGLCLKQICNQLWVNIRIERFKNGDRSKISSAKIQSRHNDLARDLSEAIIWAKKWVLQIANCVFVLLLLDRGEYRVGFDVYLQVFSTVWYEFGVDHRWNAVGWHVL